MNADHSYEFDEDENLSTITLEFANGTTAQVMVAGRDNELAVIVNTSIPMTSNVHVNDLGVFTQESETDE